MAITMLPWRHASELAFVCDCFYSHHKSSPSLVEDDIYTVSIPTENDPDQDTTTLTDASAQKAQGRVTNYKIALQHVAIWTFKSPRNVPHAVAATAALIEARMHDEQNANASATTSLAKVSAGLSGGGGSSSTTVNASVLTETVLKSLYAMAFLRFVNGFVDRDVSRSSHRTGLSSKSTTTADNSDLVEDDELSSSIAKNAGESSMYAFAATIGMPGAFVDLRHRCVHGAVLPELNVLRAVSERALEWLWERWWKGNVVGDSGRWLWEREVEAERQREARGAVEDERSQGMDVGTVMSFRASAS